MPEGLCNGVKTAIALAFELEALRLPQKFDHLVKLLAHRLDHFGIAILEKQLGVGLADGLIVGMIGFISFFQQHRPFPRHR